jgi:hypothetical protein
MGVYLRVMCEAITLASICYVDVGIYLLVTIEALFPLGYLKAARIKLF